jgi:short-subunit dehydrogenase
MKRKAMVTGASEGIGREFALALAKNGYEIVAAARNEQKLRSLVEELGQGHAYRVADLSTVDGQKRLSEELDREHFDLLVNNAGAGLLGAFQETSLDRTLAMMHLNCDAVVMLAHAFLRKAREGDALINVSSGVAFLPMANLSVYCATKAFVTSFSESLWYEQKRRGVFVMGLCPGITSTNFQINSGGRNEDLPKGMSQTATEVVEAALKALGERNAPTVATNMKNAFFTTFVRSMPRKAAATMMGKMSQARKN